MCVPILWIYITNYRLLKLELPTSMPLFISTFKLYVCTYTLVLHYTVKKMLVVCAIGIVFLEKTSMSLLEQ